MEVLIRNDSPTGAVNEETLEENTRRILSALGSAEAEVSIWLCDDAEIQALHAQYFDIDEPTNVISFSQREGEFGEVEPEMLGDIVISYETAARDAAEAGKTLDDEVLFLTIHGLLHLHGYDHEGERASDAPEMEAKEEELFRMAKGLG